MRASSPGTATATAPSSSIRSSRRRCRIIRSSMARWPISRPASRSNRSFATPRMGAAEVLYGLGGAGSRQGDELAALIYLRLALYLRPDHALGRGDRRRSLRAAQAEPGGDRRLSRRVPASSPMRENADIQAGCRSTRWAAPMRRSSACRTSSPRNPKDVDALSALGSLQRSAKKFEEAAANPTPRRSTFSPSPIAATGRCSTFARSASSAPSNGRRPRPISRRRCELFPDQPLVLNYLGYSWVDQGINLDEAFKMLRRAVDLRPTDGYVVDSLGWANYKLGHYDEATRELEKAIELKPADPVVNDHLGDAYCIRRMEGDFLHVAERRRSARPAARLRAADEAGREDRPRRRGKHTTSCRDAAARSARARLR